MYSGKSTLAKAIKNRIEDEFEVYVGIDGFANPLKSGAAVMGIPVDGPQKDRHFLQYVGTELIRNNPRYGIDHWVNLMAKNLERYVEPREGFIIDDLRYRNEFDWCKKNGFTLIRLEVDPQIQAQRAVGLGVFPDVEYALMALSSQSAHTSETDMAGQAGWDLVFPAGFQETDTMVDLVFQYLEAQ